MSFHRRVGYHKFVWYLANVNTPIIDIPTANFVNSLEYFCVGFWFNRISFTSARNGTTISSSVWRMQIIWSLTVWQRFYNYNGELHPKKAWVKYMWFMYVLGLRILAACYLRWAAVNLLQIGASRLCIMYLYLCLWHTTIVKTYSNIVN